MSAPRPRRRRLRPTEPRGVGFRTLAVIVIVLLPVALALGDLWGRAACR